ncbi:MAG: hypothetical protein ABSG16_13625 [Candidatus Acidiferrum sp.]
MRVTDVKQKVAGYGNYQKWLANTQLKQRVSHGDYSVSNRGLRSALVGTSQQVPDRIDEFEHVGVDFHAFAVQPTDGRDGMFFGDDH